MLCTKYFFFHTNQDSAKNLSKIFDVGFDVGGNVSVNVEVEVEVNVDSDDLAGLGGDILNFLKGSTAQDIAKTPCGSKCIKNDHDSLDDLKDCFDDCGDAKK